MPGKQISNTLKSASVLHGVFPFQINIAFTGMGMRGKDGLQHSMPFQVAGNEAR
jgi:hypothetical protein